MKNDKGIYSRKERERMVDEDAINTFEDTFMQGYEEALAYY